MQAVILGAGLGERLRPLTSIMAKPAVQILDKPLIWHIIKNLTYLNLTSIAITLFYKPNSVLSLDLENNFLNMPLQFIVESHLLGTGGGIRNALRYLSDDLTIICNGDILYDFNLEAAIDSHISSGCAVSLVLTTTPDWQDYTVIRTNQNGQIVRIGYLAETPHASDSISRPYTFTGIYILQTALLERLPQISFFDLIKDFIVPLMKTGVYINGIVIDGFWSDMGTPRRYLSGCLKFAQYLIGAPARVVVGENCFLEENVQLIDSVLWDNISIGSGADLRECIVTRDVKLDRMTKITGAIIIPESSIMTSIQDYKSIKIGNALAFQF